MGFKQTHHLFYKILTSFILFSCKTYVLYFI